jgi:hypothetical protein
MTPLLLVPKTELNKYIRVINKITIICDALSLCRNIKTKTIKKIKIVGLFINVVRYETPGVSGMNVEAILNTKIAIVLIITILLILGT